MTFKYLMIRAGARIIRMRSRFAGTPEELVAKHRKNNAKNKIPVMESQICDVTEEAAFGCRVFKMLQKKKTDREKERKACLYLIGGAMLMEPKASSVKRALQLAEETGYDMFVPFYPLCTEYPITKAYEMIHEYYKLLLKQYKPENILILGSSAGGGLALGLPAYINEEKKDVPMPGKIIALSPGTGPCSEEEWKKLEELDRKDFSLPSSFFRIMETIFRHGEKDIPDYMLRLQQADFTNCPETVLFFGTWEMLYAELPGFEAALKKYGVKVKTIVQEEMFHCYPVFPICPEAKIGWDRLVQEFGT